MPSFSATGSPHKLLRRSEGEEWDVSGKAGITGARVILHRVPILVKPFFLRPHKNSSPVERKGTNSSRAKSERIEASAAGVRYGRLAAQRGSHQRLVSGSLCYSGSGLGGILDLETQTHRNGACRSVARNVARACPCLGGPWASSYMDCGQRAGSARLRGEGFP